MCAAGIFNALANGIVGRPAVAAKMLEQHDIISVLMAILRQKSLATLVAAAGYARHAHGGAFHVLALFIETAQVSGIDLTSQLLSCGCIDLVVAAISTVEEVGADNTNGLTGTMPVWILKTLTGEALDQIEDKVRAIPSALRYVKDSQLGFSQGFGITASVIGTIVAANVYGKDEDNTFGLARECFISRVRAPACSRLTSCLLMLPPDRG